MGKESMKSRLAVVADDLTGANDTGVQYAKHGLETAIITKSEYLERVAERVDVIVMDTESRADRAEVAYSKVRKVVEILLRLGIDVIYKKVDSTLRGNLGAELDAIMDISKTETAAFVPAFPANGRITVGGYQLVNQVPLGLTEVSKDPLTPMRESHVPTILMAQTKRTVVHIPLSRLTDSEDLEDELKRIRDGKGGIVVIDAATQSDLKTIAIALDRVGLARVVCGSAGLAEEMPGALGVVTSKPVILISGSVSEVTMRQLRRVSENKGVPPITLDTKHILMMRERKEEEIVRVLGIVKTQLKDGMDCVVTSAISRENVENDLRLGRSLGLSNAEIDAEIVTTLGEVVKRISPRTISGIVLTGGAIAVGVLKAIEAYGIMSIEEVTRGIPMGQIMGGPFDGLGVVTKAGAFGNDDTMIVCIEQLKRRKI